MNVDPGPRKLERLGRRPVLALVPFGGLVAIFVGNLLYAVGWARSPILRPEPLGFAIVGLLVLATLLVIICGAAVWLRDQSRARFDELLEHLVRADAELHAELGLMRDTLERLIAGAPRVSSIVVHPTAAAAAAPRWNWNTQVNMNTGHVYGQPSRPAVTDERVPSIDEQIRRALPPEGDTGEVTGRLS